MALAATNVNERQQTPKNVNERQRMEIIGHFGRNRSPTDGLYCQRGHEGRKGALVRVGSLGMAKATVGGRVGDGEDDGDGDGDGVGVGVGVSDAEKWR